MKIKKTLLFLAFIFACTLTAYGQEAEFSSSGGTAGAITAAPGSGTAGKLPVFASATSLADSKWTMSGTNLGTATLYDDTLTIGVTQRILRAGAGQGTTPLEEWRAADDSVLLRVTSGGHLLGNASASLTDALLMKFNVGALLGNPALVLTRGDGGGGASVQASSVIMDTSVSVFSGDYSWRGGVTSFDLGSDVPVRISTDTNANSGTYDLGLARSAPGILKVTDGSTGSGGIGISDAATATVTDALILRHATTDAGFGQDGFGTGLLFQAENDVGTMHDAASIDAVFVDSADGSEDSKLQLVTMYNGTLTEAGVFDIDTGNPRLTFNGSFAIVRASANMAITLGGKIYFTPETATNAWIMSGASLSPGTTNAYNIGTTTEFVKDSYLGTSIQGARTTALTDNAAAKIFVTITDATSDTALGGEVQYVVEAIDAGTAMQVRSGTLRYSASNIGGTVTVSVVDDPDFAAHLSTGTLGVTFSATVTGTTVNLLVVADTSLDAGAETVQIKHRTYVNNGSGTVTPQA